MTIYAKLSHGVFTMFRLFLFWFSFFLRSSCFARSCDCVTDWLRTLDSFMEYSTCNYGVQILIRQRLSIRAIPAVFQAHLIQLNLLIKNCLVTFFLAFNHTKFQVRSWSKHVDKSLPTASTIPLRLF